LGAPIAGLIQPLLQFTDVSFTCGKRLGGRVDGIGAEMQRVRMRNSTPEHERGAEIRNTLQRDWRCTVVENHELAGGHALADV
jgi:hypothetical protein